jgi:transglutaminase-like putative cysteine protease
MTETPGVTVWTGSDGKIEIDASNTSKGYICVKYAGTADRVQVQVTNPDGSRNPYPLKIGSYEGIPLTGGNGDYSVQVLEHVSGKTYAIGLSQTFSVQLENEFTPYLYPNQYCDYKADDEAVKKGQKLSDQSVDDLDYIRNVYNFVISTIKYDDDLAANIPVNYLPDPDTTLETKKGICLDYASLTTAMLRSQNIPSKLEVGYSGDVYHAWISVWTEETGWIDKAIRFDGKDWTLVDPTLGANNSAASVKKYVGDGDNYTLSYNY